MAKGKIKLNIGPQPIDWTDPTYPFNPIEIYTEITERLYYDYGSAYSVITGQVLGELGTIGVAGYVVVKSNQTGTLGASGYMSVVIGFTPPFTWAPPYVNTVVCLGEPVTITII